MPLLQALRLAPGAAVVDGDHHKYSSYTKRILAILLETTHRIEPVSIDEAFLDTAGLLCDPAGLAMDLQRRILDRTGLWASVGLGPNKLLAKMASKKAKPRGIRILQPDDIIDFGVESIWGVGPGTASLLRGYGIGTVGELRRLTLPMLRIMLGVAGEALYFLCRGVDTREIRPFYEVEPPKSISHEHTFVRDVGMPSEYLPVLALLAQKVGRRARDEGFAGGTVTLKYRLPDLSHHSRARGLGSPTDQDQIIFDLARDMAAEAVRGPVRLLGIALGDLSPVSCLQLGLFHEGAPGLNRAADMVRKKYGEKAVTSCRALSAIRH
jgi:DNA polymerase-4